MNTYEGLFLLDPRKVEKGSEGAHDLVLGLLNKVNAKPLTSGKWDERKLAYPIEHQRRGVYVLAYFEAPSESIDVLNRECQLSESVLRSLVLRHDKEVPKEIPPPVIVKKSDFPGRESGYEKGGGYGRDSGYRSRVPAGAYAKDDE